MFKRKKKKRALIQFQPFPANWFVVGALLVAGVLTIVLIDAAPLTAADDGQEEPFDVGLRILFRACLLILVWIVPVLSVIFRLGGTTVERRKVPKRGQKTP